MHHTLNIGRPSRQFSIFYQEIKEIDMNIITQEIEISIKIKIIIQLKNIRKVIKGKSGKHVI